jgi:hypothetical protein
MQKKIFFFKVAAVFLPFVILFLLEISAQLFYFFQHNRTFLYQTRAHDKTGFLQMDELGLLWFKKNSTVRLKHYSTYAADLYTDNFGLIHNGSEFREPPDPLNFNIIFLGGSTVEGRGSTSNKNTIPALLESCLREKNKKINIYNFGFSGDNSFNENLRIHSKSEYFKPDLVIALDGRNDFDTFYTKKSLLNNSHVLTSNLTYIYNNLSKLEFSLGLLNEYMTENIVLYKYFYMKLKNKKEDETKRFYHNLSKEHKLVYLAYHQSSASWLKLRYDGIKYAVFFQPTLAYKKKKTNEEIIHIENFNKKINDFGDYNKNLYNFYDLFLEKEKNLNYDLFNLSDIFEYHNHTAYVDSVHYNDAGNLYIAKKMCNIIKKNYLRII